MKFKNMRRAGRHPRFFTYAKLITAAAKEDRLNLAHDILNLAKQDVPLLPQYRIVRYGWVTILDAMVAAQEVFIWLDPNLPAEERLKAMSKLAKNLRRHPNPSSLSHGLLDAHPRSLRESGSYSFMGEPDYVSDSVKLEFHVTR